MSQPKSPTPASSRRTFLKTTAAAAVASQLIVPQGVRAAGSEVVKFGLIGCGGRGTGAGGQALSANPSNHLTAIGDLWPEPIDRALASYSKSHPEQIKVTPDTKFTGVDAFKKVIDSGVDVV